MKKIQILIMFLFVGIFCYAKEVKTFDNSIQLEPLSSSKSPGGLAIEYQHSLANSIGISIALMYTNDSIYNNSNKEDIDIIECGIKFGVLYQPFEHWLKGLYIGAIPTVIACIPEKEYDHFYLLGLYSLIGYQFIFNNGITINLGLGAKYFNLLSKDEFNLDYNLSPAIKMSIGYSF